MGLNISGVLVWHNPGCGSSNNAVEYLRAKGIEPEIFLYLKEKPSKAQIETVLKAGNMLPSALLRPNDKQAQELGLYDGASEASILEAMATHSKFIQRPIVITAKGAVIARPKTRIEEVL